MKIKAVIKFFVLNTSRFNQNNIFVDNFFNESKIEQKIWSPLPWMTASIGLMDDMGSQKQYFGFI